MDKATIAAGVFLLAFLIGAAPPGSAGPATRTSGALQVKEGDLAPDFSLPDENGDLVTLRQFRGKPVVLYFYPKDMTPGCTKEACDFRDNWSVLQKKGAVVLGISADDDRSHRRFKSAYSLPFPLLSDPKKKVLKKYGVWGDLKLAGVRFKGIVRTTLLIGKDGRILKIWSPVDVTGHARDVLKHL